LKNSLAQISDNDISSLIDLVLLEREPRTVERFIASSVVELAAKNGVAAWLYYRIKQGYLHGVDENVQNRLKSVYINNFLLFQQLVKVFEKIQSLLLQNDIPVVALKGFALALDIYPDSGLRPMSDIDILVPEGKGFEALSILQKNGARKSSVPRSRLHETVNGHVRAIVMDGVLIEIHQRLFPIGSIYHRESTNLFEHTVPVKKGGVEFYRLDDLYMGYHLATHTLTTLNMGGIRLSWLLDIAMMLSKQEDKKRFLNQIININQRRKEDILKIFRMASLLLPKQERILDINEPELISNLRNLMLEKNLVKKHRFINTYEILRTPGINRKMKLLWYELFPEEEYMRFRYDDMKGSKLWRLYLKRLLRI